MLSKRTYDEPPRFSVDLMEAFNKIRPRSAEIQKDRDGGDHLYVEGWDDGPAAAVYLLVRQGIPLHLIEDRSVAGKLAEIISAGLEERTPFKEEWLGRRLLSDEGGMTKVTPPELQEEAEGSVPSAWEDPPEKTADFFLAEEEKKSPSDPEIEIRVGTDTPRATSGLDMTLLLAAPEAAITIRLSGDLWRMVKLLAVAWEASPVAVVERLMVERLHHYMDPHTLAWITGASDN